MCSLSLMLTCHKLVSFLFALSKEDKQCLLEKSPQQSAVKSRASHLLLPREQFNCRNVTLRFCALLSFFF